MNTVDDELDQESPQALLLEEAYQLGQHNVKNGCLIPLIEELNALVDTTVAEALEMPKVDRLEVIDNTGRAYVKGAIYGTPVKVELSLQDDGRTLKVFVEEQEV